MDRELMIKMGWDKKLIESVLKMKKTIDKSLKYSSDSVALIQSTIAFNASSTKTEKLARVASNVTRVKLR